MPTRYFQISRQAYYYKQYSKRNDTQENPERQRGWQPGGTYENIPDGQVWPWHMTGQTDQSNVNHRHEELNIIIQDTFILLTYTSAESMSLYNDKIEVFSSGLLMDNEYFRNLGGNQQSNGERRYEYEQTFKRTENTTSNT